MTRPFRFGVVAPVMTDLPTWRDKVRRIADSGYSTLLMPDVLQLPAPGPALAVAAAAADIRVGTWVYAAPLRPPRMTAREAHTLSLLTDGRFDMGIGSGRPGMEASLAQLGLEMPSPAARLAQVAATIDALRELDGPDRHTPVLMAAAGPRALAMAAEKADIVTLATGPLTPRAEAARLAADLRARLAGHGRDAELVMNLVAVGDTLPATIEAMTGADAATLIAADSLALLRGDTQARIDELQRRRDEFGASYVGVNAQFMDELAPAVAALTGR